MKRCAVLIAVCAAMISCVEGVAAQGPAAPAKPKTEQGSGRPADVKAKIKVAAKQAQFIFVATVTKVTELSQPEGVPPSLLMEVAVKDRAVLKGPAPGALSLPLTFSYSTVKGQDFIPGPGNKVLVMGHAMLSGPLVLGRPALLGQEPKVGIKLQVELMVAATEANVALARKIAGPNTPEGKLEAAVRAGKLVFTATVDKLVMFGAVQPPIQQVTVKNVTVLKGEKPAHLDFRYPRTADLPFNPDLGQRLLCAADAEPEEEPSPPGAVSAPNTGRLPRPGGNGPEIFFMVEATEENIALAKRVLGPPASKPRG